MSATKVHVYDDVPALLNATADFVRDTIADTLMRKPLCFVALSGGNTPRALYAMLAADPYRKEIEWDRIRFFFGDERFVPHDHPDSNFRMAKESLFDPAGVDMKNVFPVSASMPPHQAAAEYEKTIKAVIGASGVFDIILLGLGNDAHTASLFPNSDVLEERSAWVKEVYVKSLKAWRITFTATLINAARAVVFLTHGSSKARAVKNVFEGKRDPESYPAQLVAPVSGDTHWFLDSEAAAQIRAR